MSLTLIGGDMPAWSDLDGSHGPGPVRGEVLKALLDGSLLDGSLLDGSLLGGSLLGGSLLGGSLLDGSLLDGSLLGGCLLDSRRPDGPRPDSPRPDSPMPDSSMPDSPTPDSPRPDSPRPNSPRPDSPRPNSSTPDSSRLDSLRLDGPLLGGSAGRVLVLGPHDPALFDRLPATDLTFLVRGIPDAEALTARLPGATICCGAPEKLAAEAPFDTVIALDGLDRLSSVEGAQLDWATAADLLLGWLRPGGRLLLGLANLFGLDRLVALPAELTDSDWTPLAQHDRTRPTGLAALLDHLPRPATAYAAFPSVLAPTALVEVGALRDPDNRESLETTLGEACRPTTDVLTDPRALAIGALRHGLAAELAPGWIVVTGAAMALPLMLTAGGGLAPVESSPVESPSGESPSVGSPRCESPPARVLADVLAERDRLARELADARAKAAWYEETLTARENALKRAQRTVDLLSAKGPARLGAAFVGGARAARRSARAVIRRVTPRS